MIVAKKKNCLVSNQKLFKYVFDQLNNHCMFPKKLMYFQLHLLSF